MATILTAPAGISEIHISGRAYRRGADGTISANDLDVPQLLAAGFTKAIVPDVSTTAGRPTAGNFAGRMVFDSTLGKPIWRNAANSAWVDATGTAV